MNPEDDTPLFADNPAPTPSPVPEPNPAPELSPASETAPPQNPSPAFQPTTEPIMSQPEAPQQPQPIMPQYSPASTQPKKKSPLTIILIVVLVFVAGLVIFRKFGDSNNSTSSGSNILSDDPTSRVYDVGETFDAGYGVKISLSDIKIMDDISNTNYVMKIDITNTSSYNIMSATDNKEISLDFYCFNMDNKKTSGTLVSDSGGRSKVSYPLSKNGTYYLVCNRTYLDDNLVLVGLALWNHDAQQVINSYITEK